MSIRNFSKLFSKMVCREPLQMPRFIPFRNFSMMNKPESSDFNMKMNEPKKPPHSQESILFDKSSKEFKGEQQQISKQEMEDLRNATTPNVEKLKPVSETVSQNEGSSNQDKSRNAEFEGQTRGSQLNQRTSEAETTATKPDCPSELNANQSNIFQQHEPAASELTCRAKQLEDLTKRDYHQCLDLCVQHPEKSAEQIVEMINKAKEEHKKAE